MIKVQDEFVREFAKKYNMTLVEMEAILNSPFRFTKDKMSSGELKNIMLPFLGKFVVTQHARRKQEVNSSESPGYSELPEECSSFDGGDRTEG